MYVVIALMGIIFFAVGLILTPKNAKYILAGYNTMSPQERERVDITNYVAFFKKFHFIFAVLFTVIGMLLNLIFNETISALFLFLFPVLGYTWLFVKARKYTS